MLNCAVNPQACRERVTAYEPIVKPKKVLVVGGGVAGCEAARVLAERRHNVTLCEAKNRLGGNLIPGGAPDFKEDDIALAEWYANEMKRLNIDVKLNAKVSKADVLAGQYDTVIIATGSTPKTFSLGDDEHTYAAEQVLLKRKECGGRVAIIGGGLVGCETALWLSQNGKRVTIVEALNGLLAVGAPLCHANSDMLKELIPFNGIDVITGAKATTFANGALTVETADGTRELPCDSVVLCVGYKEESDLYEQLQFDIPEIYLLGDAKKVANIMTAIWDAFEVANHI